MSRLTENLKRLEEMGKLNKHHMGILENSLEEHDKEIRNKAIDEFAERLSNKDNIVRFDIGEAMSNGNFDYNCDCLRRYIDEITEEMRGVR